MTPSRSSPWRALLVLGTVAAVLTGMVACGGGGSTTTQTTTSPGSGPPVGTTAPTSVTIDLVAENIAFNMKTITVPAGATVKVNFNNKDPMAHNFAVYQNQTGGGTKAIFVGEIITGPKTIAYTFTAPAAGGSYFFRCDVHPGQMNGIFTAQ